jgi:2,5-diketo-D-gluconate reductase B
MDNLHTQGIDIPRLGLGTFRMKGEVCQAAVESALALGYRHIDTGAMYGNEEAVGAALKAAGVPRKELHITTKVWHDQLAPDAIRRALDTSMGKLGLDSVELYMVHWPSPTMDLRAVFDTMLALRDEGRFKTIGVCNFTHKLIRQTVDELKVPIAAHQFEYHVLRR